MLTTCNVFIVIAITMLTLSSVVKAGDCQFPVLLLRQHRDIATIEALELEWTRAYLRGDTGFEACLLTADFTEIMRSGEVKHLSDELALAARNTAHPFPIGEMPKDTVLLHGNVAVLQRVRRPRLLRSRPNVSSLLPGGVLRTSPSAIPPIAWSSRL